MTEPNEDPGGEKDRDRRDDDDYPDKDNPEYQMEEEEGPGGYDGRDPATDMPRMPGVPETQDE
ncbi:MAG: hypothetical protein M3Z06_01865 [Actinomycetota bacterium]|nr:hypothetical protein [Actinomycetota bacterium]